AKLSVEENNQGYMVRFDLNGRLSDEQGRTVYQFETSLPLILNQDQLSEIGKRAVSFQDVFPLIPGNYTFDLLIKNPLSREFSSFTQKLSLPERDEAPAISQILLAYDSLGNQDTTGIKPFQIGSKLLLSRCRKSFSRSESLLVGVQVSGLSEELRKKSGLKIVLATDSKPVFSQEKKLNAPLEGSFFLETIPLNSYQPGYYSLSLDLIVEGQVKDSRRTELEISTQPAIPVPILVSRANLVESEQLFLVGLQYLNNGRNQEAIRNLSKAYFLKPELKKALAYGQALFRIGDYQKAIEVLKPYDQPEAPAELLSVLGGSYQSLNQPDKALVYYEQYLNRFGVDIDILNYIGTCYYQLGDKEKALITWEKSLSLKPDQEKLKELVNSLKKK
ncbi:MAG: tetratricopeptide repeat protein, partial [Candidatus Saccharicenans sp.]